MELLEHVFLVYPFYSLNVDQSNSWNYVHTLCCHTWTLRMDHSGTDLCLEPLSIWVLYVVVVVESDL